MSDIDIERIIKRNSFQLKHGQNVHYLRANAAVEEVARAVAERMRESARVCQCVAYIGCHVQGTPDCPRCRGRGVTFRNGA